MIDRLVDLLNEFETKSHELKDESELYRKRYDNLVKAIVRTCNDLPREGIYLGDFDVCKRITEYEREMNDE